MANNNENERQDQVLVAPEGNPTTEGEMQLANNGARPLAKNNPNTNNVTSAAVQSGNRAWGNGFNMNAGTPSFSFSHETKPSRPKPLYSPEKKKELAHITDIEKSERERIKSDERYHALTDSDGNIWGVLIYLAIQSGVKFYKPRVNREHGKDKEKTGISIRMYGAQEALTVCTAKAALVAGLDLVSFTDPKEEIDMDGLVIINGNGRMEYLSQIDQKDWGIIIATFIVPDALDYYNPCDAFAQMNLYNTPWKAKDMAQKRMLSDDNPHPGWAMIDKLTKNHYNYQAACQVVTLGTDRIKAKEADSGDSNAIFRDYDDAIKIHDAVIHRFGDVESIKGKFFTQCISQCWANLRKDNGNAKATTDMVAFIEQLSGEVINNINTATNKKGEPNKDQKRANLLEAAFKAYFGIED